MRIRINLDLKDKTISVNYNSILQGIIYHALPDTQETKELHDVGNVLNNFKFKLFTFSELYGETIYNKDNRTLKFTNQAYFDFTAFNEEYVYSMMSFLDNNPHVIIKDQIIKVIDYEILNDTLIKDTTITFTTESPIICYRTNEERKIIYYEPNSDDFKELVISNLAKKYFLAYHENMPDISIDNICNIKKKKVYYRNLFFISYHLQITIANVDKKLQNIILTSGLGIKNASGFGMVSLLK